MAGEANNKNGKKENIKYDIGHELHDIKQLLILLLLKGGTTQAEIAKCLEINQSTVSRQFNFGKLKPFEVA